MTLDPKRRDAWGIPVLHIDCSHGQAELVRAREQASALRELAEVAGVTLTQIDEAPEPPGSASHECGTARMGSDPANSVLDPHNECWEARGLYVTDGGLLSLSGHPKSNADHPRTHRPRLRSRIAGCARELGFDRAFRHAFKL